MLMDKTGKNGPVHRSPTPGEGAGGAVPVSGLVQLGPRKNSISHLVSVSLGATLTEKIGCSCSFNSTPKHDGALEPSNSKVTFGCPVQGISASEAVKATTVPTKPACRFCKLEPRTVKLVGDY
jgi:hypothetical protein